MDAILSATKLGGEIMMMGNELGQIKPGYLADILLVDGNPLANVKILQDADKLLAIMKDGEFHKEPLTERSAASDCIVVCSTPQSPLRGLFFCCGRYYSSVPAVGREESQVEPKNALRLLLSICVAGHRLAPAGRPPTESSTAAAGSPLSSAGPP